jgi:bifunctional non-homologous end joining protein LigD
VAKEKSEKKITDLSEYRRKRHFDKTPEPEGGKAEGGVFVVHKHAASHLHYDFRISLEGVLKSWAVPKGPSLDPAVKRLAVHVEDHPYDYKDFEGTIPQGEYGGGTVMIWDKGTWIPDHDPAEMYAKGSMKFTLLGQKLKGKWALARMKKVSEKEGRESWLLIKEKDEYARPGSGDELVNENPLSAATGRDMDEIASGAKPEAVKKPSDTPKKKGDKQ